MLRNTIVAVAAAAAIGALASTAASAAPGHNGGRSVAHGQIRTGHMGHFGRSVHIGHVGHNVHSFRTFHRGPGLRFVAPLYESCWSWVPGRFGPVSVWICD
jgi:hypothetical protein